MWRYKVYVINFICQGKQIDAIQFALTACDRLWHLRFL